VDQVTDGFFTANALDLISCKREEVREIWDLTMQQSVFRFLPLWRTSAHLELILIAAWVISLLQMVWPIAATLSCRCLQGSIVYEVGDNGVIGVAGLEANPCIGKTDHDEVFENLSEASGMASFMNTHTDIIESKITDPNYAMAYLEVVVFATNAASVLAVRIVLSALLENCLQLNVQTSIFAISRHISITNGRHINITNGLTAITTNSTASVQLVVSIVIAFAMTFHKLEEVWRLFQISKIVFAQRHRAQGSDEYSGGGEDSQLPDGRRNSRTSRLAFGGARESQIQLQTELQLEKFRMLLRVVGVSCVLIIITLLYCMGKFVGAFLCKDSLWNITGCVSLP
jgi:hypothetical protein